MAEAIAHLHVETPDSPGFADELRRWIEHIARFGHTATIAQVTHGAGTPAEDVEHLVGGPSGDVAAADAVAASESDAEGHAADAAAAPAPATQA